VFMSGGLLLVATPRLLLVGCVRGESWYQCRPTCWWDRELQRYVPMLESYSGAERWLPSTWLREADPWERFLAQWFKIEIAYFREKPSALLTGDPDALPVLVELLGSDERRVRQQAALGLAKLGPLAEQAWSVLAEAARNDPDEDVYHILKKLLWDIDLPRARGVLSKHGYRTYSEEYEVWEDRGSSRLSLRIHGGIQ
jgi:HEAT repeats